MKAIEITNLTKLYGNSFIAVDTANFSVDRGEVLALLGPNGAGKTTIFKMLTALSKPNEGEIKILGMNLGAEPKSIKEKIGYSCQEIGLDPESSVLFNLKLFGRYYHIYGKKLTDRVNELIQLFELNGIEKKKVKLLSGGMKKKVELATSLIAKPEILFLDEPTLGLDIEFRKKLWNYIEKLNKEEKMTIVLTTHYLEEAEYLCDKLVIIEKGKVKVEGYIEDLKKQSLDEVIKIECSKYEDENNIERVFQKLKVLPFVKNSVYKSNNINLYVENGRRSIQVVLNTLDQEAVDIKNVSISEASLEDIYLKYTGSYI